MYFVVHLPRIAQVQTGREGEAPTCPLKSASLYRDAPPPCQNVTVPWGAQGAGGTTKL